MPYLKINYSAEEGRLLFETVNLPWQATQFNDKCCELIGCDCIESIDTLIYGIKMLSDKDYKTWDGWEKRINKYATFLRCNSHEPIAGDVILAHKVDGQLYPLSEGEIYHIVQTLSQYFSLEVKNA